jgi:hypothetical protein
MMKLILGIGAPPIERQLPAGAKLIRAKMHQRRADALGLLWACDMVTQTEFGRIRARLVKDMQRDLVVPR